MTWHVHCDRCKAEIPKGSDKHIRVVTKGCCDSYDLCCGCFAQLALFLEGGEVVMIVMATP